MLEEILACVAQVFGTLTAASPFATAATNVQTRCASQAFQPLFDLSVRGRAGVRRDWSSICQFLTLSEHLISSRSRSRAALCPVSRAVAAEHSYRSAAAVETVDQPFKVCCQPSNHLPFFHHHPFFPHPIPPIHPIHKMPNYKVRSYDDAHGRWQLHLCSRHRAALSDGQAVPRPETDSPLCHPL